ncbi:hypothetical protein AMTR_s00067p00155100 [Amborella trichopoda]|uniref:Prolamin-like domain-containing protein n=1 Tax=Amborella trichopoda TaxID=13333 RepID=U5DBS7_AMBTC|nr:hypothetical protein AMTR_s00067p00155100 [Amborella trichopoda]
MASYKASALLLMILLTLVADQALASKPTDATEDGYFECFGAVTYLGGCIQSLIKFITKKGSNPEHECCDAVLKIGVECIANLLIVGGIDGGFANQLYEFCALNALPPEASGPAGL